MLPASIPSATPVQVFNQFIIAGPGSTVRDVSQTIYAGAAPAQELAPPALPALAGVFVGRQRELADLAAALNAGMGKSITLAVVGMGGCGKTFLAFCLAEAQKEQFPAGIFCATLSDRPEDTLTLLAIWAQVCGERDLSAFPDPKARAAVVRSLLETRVSRLGRLLILIDGASSERRDQVETILEARPSGFPVLLTTRDRQLAADLKAQIHPLDNLPLVDACKLLEELGGEPVRRAPSSAEELARRVERLPLALSLLGNLVALNAVKPGWELANLIEALDGQLAPKALSDLGEPGLLKTFALSYHTLKTNQQRIFRTLGAFAAAPVQIAPVAGILGWDPKRTEKALDALVHRSLLKWADHTGGTARYQLHALLHDYAAYLLRVSRQESAVRAAHARQILHYAQAHKAQAIEDYQALDLELANLRLALDYFDRMGMHSDYIALTLALRHFLEIRGYWREGQKYLLRALEIIHASLPGQAHSEIILERGLGSLSYNQGDFSLARQHYWKSILISRKVNDIEGRLRGLYNLALAYADQEKFNRALILLQIATNLEKEQPEPDWSYRVACKQQMSKCYLGLERYLDAEAQLQECLAIHERHAEVGGNTLAYTHYFLGILNFFQGRFDQAGEHYQRALEIHRTLGNRAGIVESSADLAEVFIITCDLEQARGLMDQALEIAVEYGYTQLAAYIQEDLERKYQAALARCP